MLQYDTLEKNELKITHITLDNTNLGLIADCVADVYGVDRSRVLVIDVRNEEVALDILDHNLEPRNFVGKEKQLLSMLAEVPGVCLSEKSHVISEGMLGWITYDAEEKEILKSIEAAETMSERIMEAVSKRVIVFPSGTEVINGEIEDTNTPMLVTALKEAGFQAEAGRAIPDDETVAAQILQESIWKGFGTIITTGGVGAEDKDHSVEAILRLDPRAAAPYIAKFQKGHGRHTKDGIRICVGSVDFIRLVALPGPNDEVSACLPSLIADMKVGADKAVTANHLANILRSRLKEKCHNHHSHNHHNN